jgi:hypothetical protein
MQRFSGHEITQEELERKLPYGITDVHGEPDCYVGYAVEDIRKSLVGFKPIQQNSHALNMCINNLVYEYGQPLVDYARYGLVRP